MPLQKHHNLFDVFLFLPAIADFLHAFLTESRHFKQPLDVVFNHIDCLQSETANNSLGVCRADTLYQTAAEIFLNTIQSCGHDLRPRLSHKLLTIFRVNTPVTVNEKNTTYGYVKQRAGQGHEIVISFDLDFHHRPAIFLILVSDMLDYTPQLNHYILWAVIMVLLFALTVMRTCPAVTYQFLPLRSNVAKSSRMKHLQKSTASRDSGKLRFLLIRSTPNGVVCKSVILNGYSAVGHIINPSH